MAGFPFVHPFQREVSLAVSHETATFGGPTSGWLQPGIEGAYPNLRTGRERAALQGPSPTVLRFTMIHLLHRFHGSSGFQVNQHK